MSTEPTATMTLWHNGSGFQECTYLKSSSVLGSNTSNIQTIIPVTSQWGRDQSYPYTVFFNLSTLLCHCPYDIHKQKTCIGASFTASSWCLQTSNQFSRVGHTWRIVDMCVDVKSAGSRQNMGCSKTFYSFGWVYFKKDHILYVLEDD